MSIQEWISVTSGEAEVPQTRQKHTTKDKINMADFTTARNLQGRHTTQPKQRTCSSGSEGTSRASSETGVGCGPEWQVFTGPQHMTRCSARTDTRERQDRAPRSLRTNVHSIIHKAQNQTIRMSTHGRVDRMHNACTLVTCSHQVTLH